MPLISWNESYSVGIPRLDNQHKRIFEFIDLLFDAMCKGQGRGVIGKVIDDLVSYTEEHFGCEEHLMRTHGFTDYLNHKRVHDGFIAKVREFRDRHRQDDTTVPADVARYLREWLTNHINGMDKGYRSFFSKLGVE
ncbi:MAG: bacteriohemerythrin [Deltaproteobacteria bacterium]|nr:bacteriohemerythrin [Deltaproteobacteria bacterium]